MPVKHVETTPDASPAPRKRVRGGQLLTLLTRRVVILDGAMGTMIQRRRLGEAEFRGTRFAQRQVDLRGNNDVLVLTQPQIVAAIHREYLLAGADVISTNTFNSTPVSQAGYGLESLAAELNFTAARLARRTADEVAAQTGRPRFVAGVLGPTHRRASLSADAGDPDFRGIRFDELAAGYSQAARALIEGGVDVFLIETVFDALNAKAALAAVREAMDEAGMDVPIMVSATLSDASGRLLSGETPEAFWNSVRQAKPAVVGLNCSLGGRQMRPHIEELARVADAYVCAYPSAGLPNASGEYEATAEDTAEILREFTSSGFLNMAGGCCGTTPDHIRALVRALAGLPARALPRIAPA